MTRPTWLKSFVIGFVGALLCIVLSTIVWTTYLTYQRALAGAVAFDYIQQQIRAGKLPPLGK